MLSVGIVTKIFPTQSPVKTESSNFSILVSAMVIALVAIIFYHNIFSGPFVFDDVLAITGNPSIRNLSDAFFTPAKEGTSAAGRPIYNLTLALNYAAGGLGVRGYHAVNLAIHIFAALTLFGIMRRTLQSADLRSRFGSAATSVAFSVALLWAVHPLLTESVTLTVQRTESLMGLFFLLTFYAFIRGTESVNPGRWYALSVFTCLLGVGTKEVTATAPLLVLLYDRVFVAGTFRAAWRLRSSVYLGLAATWLPLAWLMAGTHGRGGSVGFGTDMSPWIYLLTQCRAVVMYLKLSFWPHPLVMDYGVATVGSLNEVLGQALLLCALGAGTVVALWRRRAEGFLGAWFFIILAPSSSIVPLTTQTMAEHRMYLPLAAVVAWVVSALYVLGGRRGLIVSFVLALGLGGMTTQRNADYRSAVAIWADTVEKCPDNARAHFNLGLALFAAHSTDEAIKECNLALQLAPGAEEHNLFALALAKSGRLAEALPHYEAAVRMRPDFGDAHNNYGTALMQANRPSEALLHYEQAFRLEAGNPVIAYNLGNAMIQLDRFPEALAYFRKSIHLQRDYAPAQRNLANTLLLLGRPEEAIPHYEIALRLDPNDANARENLARAKASESIPKRGP